MMIVNVSDPTASVRDLHPLDTFYYKGDVWVLSNVEDDSHCSALNLTSGSIVGLLKNTSVVKVATTLTSTADLKAIEDLAEI